MKDGMKCGTDKSLIDRDRDLDNHRSSDFEEHSEDGQNLNVYWKQLSFSSYIWQCVMVYFYLVEQALRSEFGGSINVKVHGHLSVH